MNNQIQLVLKSSTTELSLNDRELGIYLTPELDGLTGLPEIRTTSGANAGYDGGWTSAQNYDARSITIRGVIANEDVATVEQLRRQLTTLAGQGKNEELTLDLVTQAGKAYTIQVRTIALEMSLQKVLTQQEFMLQLRADDPLIYDASETGHEALLQVAQATGGFTIDFELPLAITGSSEETVVNNEGLEQVPTITRMYGALHNPKIINQTTNQFMQIEADLGFAEGDWIEPSEVVSGKDITINGAPENAPFNTLDLKGNTSQQTYTGKNLLPVRLQLGNQGITASYDANSGMITVGGTPTVEYPQLTITYSLPTPISSGTVLDFSAYQFPSNVRNIYIRLYGESGDTHTDYNLTPSTASRAFTLSSDVYRIMLILRCTVGTAISGSFGLQLEAASSATSFEPYVGGIPAPNPDYPQAVQTVTGENVVKICGKNLLKMPIVSGSSNGITWTVQDDGSIILNGTSTAGVSIRANNVTMPAVEGETYTLSATGMGEAYNFGYKNSSSGTNIFVVTSASPTTTAVVTSTMLSQANRLDMYIQSGKTFNNQRVTLQLEKGSTATTYEPYQEQSYPLSLGSIELCKIGTYQDYIYKSDDKWYKHKAIGKIVEDGSQTWYRAGTATSGKYMLDTDINDMIVMQSTSVAPPVFCTRFTPRPFNDLRNNIIGISGRQAGRSGVYIYDDVHSVANDFKNWLVSNPMTIYYALATPVEEEITNEALVAQLEAILQEATMYNPQTNITTLYAEGNEQGTLSISYFADKNPDTRDELIIDSRLRTITLNGLDVYHLQAPGSEFLMLAPGENRLSLQSDITGDNGYAQVSYKQGYLSI